jgi:hypothetical protein
MAYQATTGLGTPTKLVVTGNGGTTKNPAVTLSLSANTWPTTFQLETQIQDVSGAEQIAGTAFTLTAAANASSPADLTLSAVATSAAGVAVYTGTITGGGSNAYAGATFVVAGFATNASNNGTFQCTASTTTTLTLNNIAAIAETHAATAQDQASVTVYTGTITGGGSNAFAGFTFTVTGFATNASNNGTFQCTASNTTTLTLTNPNGVAETHAATATQQETTALTYVAYGSKTLSGNTYIPSGTSQHVATVSATGLITGVAAGGIEIEVSYPTFNNTIGDIVSSGNIMNGLPINKIYKSVDVQVLP